jgi:transmembrane 9 superfamily protein 3
MFPLLFALSAAVRYKAGDAIPVYASVVGPPDNPLELAPYSSVPLCPGTPLAPSFAAALSGPPALDIGLRLSFLENAARLPVCNRTLTVDAIAALARAVEQNHWALFSLDGFPAWVPVGEVRGEAVRVYTTFVYTIQYNDDQIVDVTIAGGDAASLEPGRPLAIGCAAVWERSAVEWRHRFAKFRDRGFFGHATHGYAVANSLLLVALLAALVLGLCSRLTGRDRAKLIQDAAFEGFDVDAGSERGWKALHGDVFRPPPRLPLWSLLAGAAGHFFAAALVYSWLTVRQPGPAGERGVLDALLAYAVSAPVAGFCAVTLGRAFNYQKWLRLALGSVWPLPASLFAGYVLTALFGAVLRPFSVRAVAVLALLQIVPVVPLAVVGGFIAVKLKLFEGPKCDVGLVPRYIASRPWYLRQPCLALAVGGACFLSVLIELYYGLTALWQYSGLYPWAYFAFAVFSLTAVASCASILAVYALLQSEVHTWQWPAFLSPAATGGFVFAYSLFFMATKTKVHGFAQIVHFVLAMGQFALLTGLLAGGAGLIAANVFVHKIFTDLKLD